MPTFPRRYSFWIKVSLAIGLVALSDVLFFKQRPGAGLGLAGLAAVAAVAAARPMLLRHRLSSASLAAAAAFALLQIERAGALGMLGFAASMAVASLAPRAARADDAWRWARRLVMAGLKSVWGPIGDIRRLLKARARSRPLKLTAVLLAAVLPVAGGLVFLWLFAIANPVIESAFLNWNTPALDIGRLLFWGAIGGAAWAVLRPRGLRWRAARPPPAVDFGLYSVTTASVTAALVVFNALFALQNGLDIAFLWSGAPLPHGVTLAGYAHRGAYPLIATALLAGAFVLVFLQPGSATANARWPRILVTVWVAQNLFLVASTVWRTLTYLDAYSLTRVRIAALMWMGLVAVGLALIGWRLLRAKSASWLINTNALAAGAVLLVCSIVDLGSVAAAWNVRHARELTGRGADLDTCYLQTLGGAALVPLAEMQRRPMPPALQARVVLTYRLLQSDMQEHQKPWRSWRFRDARRLAHARAILGGEGLPWPTGVEDNCTAKPLPPPSPAPLTPASNPRT